VKEQYGKYYWQIETERECIHLFADRLEIKDGVLMAVRAADPEKGRPEQIMFAWGSGQWLNAYAASCIDGGAVAVEHWDKKPATGIESVLEGIRSKFAEHGADG
jgi:hypothetical protein